MVFTEDRAGAGEVAGCDSLISSNTASVKFGLSEEKRKEAIARIEVARKRQEQGDAERAEMEVTNAWACLDEALTICPENHRARFLLVSCAMNADDYARAKAEALFIYKGLTQDQLEQMGDSVLHLSIAHASKMLGQMDDAIHYAAEATNYYGDEPQPYMVLGEMLEATGQIQEAEQRCRQALLHNDSPDCRHSLTSQNVFFTLSCLGSCLVRQRRLSEAEMFLTRAANMDQTSALALRQLVDVYYSQGRLDEALRTALRVRDLEPGDPEAPRRVERLRAEMAGGKPAEDASSVGSTITGSLFPPAANNSGQAQHAAASPPLAGHSVAGGASNSNKAFESRNATTSGATALELGAVEKGTEEISELAPAPGWRRSEGAGDQSSIQKGQAVSRPRGQNDGQQHKEDWWSFCCVDRD